MPRITQYSEYADAITPGLYTIVNKDSGLVLDLLRPDAPSGSSIVASKEKKSSGTTEGEDQKWQLADVGNNRWLIINKSTGFYVRAPADRATIETLRGSPDEKNVHWKIVPEAARPQIIRFQSVAYQGSVLELPDGLETNETPVQVYTSGERDGQRWLLKKA